MFSQKKLKILFNIILIIVGIFAFIQMPLLALPALGGVITNGILGGFSGKVGPVVGGKWKDIDYMRSYVIPANPNSSGQQTVRAKFSALVGYAKTLLASLLQVYWDPFYSNMSGFNAFISANYTELGAGNILDPSVIMAKGSLENVNQISSPNLSGTTLTLDYNSTINGNGLATDLVHVVVGKEDGSKLKFYVTTLLRNSATKTVTIDSGFSTDDIVWIFTSRGTGSSFMVSDSFGIIIQ